MTRCLRTIRFFFRYAYKVFGATFNRAAALYVPPAWFSTRNTVLTDFPVRFEVRPIPCLSPLSIKKTREYITLHLTAYSAHAQPLFDDDSITALFDASAGVPRRLNRIASAAMIVAASRKKQLVSAQDVLDARLDRGRS
jgi:type II secretory pathway predicted ATPase ExeA